MNTGFSIITGEQQSQGFEADLAGEILPGWNVIGGVASSMRRSRGTSRQSSATVWRACRASARMLDDLRIPRARYGLGLGAGVTYVGNRFGDVTNSYSVGAYARVDAAAWYDFDERCGLSVNLRNLTNARYIEQPFNQFNNTPGAPFTVLAAIRVRM